jgi:hypothetical protein|tara:strand:- start:1509 stop:1811 length:303 start_codon:yes stop_codon:yes gene_type:complete
MGRKLEQNRVTITRVKSKADIYTVASSNDMFTEKYIIVKVYEDSIEFSLPSIDYQGKSYSLNKNPKRKSCNFTLKTTINIEGSFLIDEEESTEDELIILL